MEDIHTKKRGIHRGAEPFGDSQRLGDAVDQKAAFDGSVLLGGHAKGRVTYLERGTLLEKVLRFWELDMPVGTICCGTLVLARITDPQTRQSLI